MAAVPPAGRVLKPGGRHWLVGALVAAGAVCVFFPFVWMALTSLKTVPEIQRVPLQITPDRWTNLDNYREVFQRQPFARFLLNSALVASVSALSSVVVSAAAGYGFAKFRFPGHGLFFFAIIGILMVPFQSVVVPLYLWVSRLNLLDTYLGILAPDLVSVFGVFLMRHSIEVVPTDYVDAARIDGAGELRILWSIALPLVRPAVLTVVLLTFIGPWNEFLWPFLVTKDASKQPLAVSLANYISNVAARAANPYGAILAGAVVLAAHAVGLFVAFQRYFRTTDLGSGVKG